MKKFYSFTSTALPIGIENIDTDQIIPARFLKTTQKQGLGKYLFYNWRFDEKDKKKIGAIFGNKRFEKAGILIAENNFGCGSSREHAVWALMDYGFKVIISTSFGDIFYNNSLKNGLLPIQITNKQLQKLFLLAEKKTQLKLTIDLKNQIVGSDFPVLKIPFYIDRFRKTCLLQGIDELGYMISLGNYIQAYENSHIRYFSVNNTKSI